MITKKERFIAGLLMSAGFYLGGCSMPEEQTQLALQQAVQEVVAPEVVLATSAPTVAPTPTPAPQVTPESTKEVKATEEPSIYQQYSEEQPDVPRTQSSVISKGVNGEISTIIGNNTAGQGKYTVDHPRFPGVNSKGDIYFLDGSQKTAKLRMFDGKMNHTVIDLRANKVTSREGEFFSTGLAVVSDDVYFSSEENVYRLIDGRATKVASTLRPWMKDNMYEYIYRMEASGDDLVLMLWSKNYTYGFIKYDLASNKIEELLPATWYNKPFNFELLPEGILVSCEDGILYYEKFFPRDTHTVVDTNEGKILDAWADADKNIYYSIIKDVVQPHIRVIPKDGEAAENLQAFAGSVAGYVDGIADEAEMYFPTDFTWDGSGYLFSDRENNAIRKLWLDSKPLSLVR